MLTGKSMSNVVNGTFNEITQLPGVTALHSNFSVQMHFTARDWHLSALGRSQIAALRELDGQQTHTDPGIAIREEHRPILSLLQQNGRCTAADVARVTGLSPTSARRQLSRVLHSDIITLRCDMAQALSGFPITAQWYARLPASQHAEAARALSTLPNMRMVCTTTGQANLLITMWLASVNDILDAQRSIETAATGIELLESALLISPSKRMGWLLRPDSTTTGRQVAPPLPLR